MNRFFEVLQKALDTFQDKENSRTRIHEVGTFEKYENCKKNEKFNESELIPLDEYPSMNMERLEMLSSEKSYRMPSRLTRAQRRQWAKENLIK